MKAKKVRLPLNTSNTLREHKIDDTKDNAIINVESGECMKVEISKESLRAHNINVYIATYFVFIMLRLLTYYNELTPTVYIVGVLYVWLCMYLIGKLE